MRKVRNAVRAAFKAVTPLGRWCVLASGLAFSGAKMLHWAEAWVVAIILLTLFVLALLGSLGRTNYRVAITLAAQRVVVGDAALGKLEITNPGRRPVPPTIVELPVGQGRAIFHIPALLPRMSHEEMFTIPTQRRGIVTVGPVTSVRGDPLGLIRRAQIWTEPVDLYIHPRTVNLETNSVGFIRDIEGVTTQELSSSDVSFHALREYESGDDRRGIHWKTTARVGKLMVRQFEETRRAHLLIVLDLNTQAWADSEEMEIGISAAASLALAAFRENRELSIVTPKGMINAPTAVRLLDLMTQLQPVTAQGALCDVVRQGVEQAVQASVAFILTGSVTSAEEIHRAYLELPLDTKSMAVQVRMGKPMESRKIGDLTTVLLPELNLLTRAVRKVS